jgi:hypothetical protein
MKKSNHKRFHFFSESESFLKLHAFWPKVNFTVAHRIMVAFLCGAIPLAEGQPHVRSILG